MSERKEIIQVSGSTILLCCMLLAVLLTVGFSYRYTQHERFVREKRFIEVDVTSLLSTQRELKEEIRKMEGVANWEHTVYAKYRGSGTDFLQLPYAL